MTRSSVPARWLAGAMCALLGVVPAVGPVVAAASTVLEAGPSRLVAIRAAHHPGFDRLGLEFSGPVPATHSVERADALWRDNAGPSRRAWVSGTTFLRIRLFPLLIEDPVRATTDRAFDLPELVEAQRIGAWEGVATWGVGLMRGPSFVRTSVLRDPGRLVIDVGASFPVARSQVLLLDREADRWTWVGRDVPVAAGVTARARDVLRRLFAGPTPVERAAGLRLVSDHVVGFRALAVSAAGVASLTLVGSCDAGGAARTLAAELLRTLKAVEGVRWVKVFDASGATRHPTGQRDSLPDCLAA